jgi:hypothetical protein
MCSQIPGFYKLPRPTRWALADWLTRSLHITHGPRNKFWQNCCIQTAPTVAPSRILIVAFDFCWRLGVNLNEGE